MQQFEQSRRPRFNKLLAQASESAYEFQVFQPRELVVKVGLFGHVAECAVKSNHVLANVLTFEQHPVHNLARSHLEADTLDWGNASEISAKICTSSMIAPSFLVAVLTSLK